MNNQIVTEEPKTLLGGGEENNLEGLKKEVISIYGICMKCKQPRSHYQWCQPCERKQSEENFSNWTSGNKEIDKFLQDTQLNSTKPQTFLEWIPFGKLENIIILCTTSKSTVYSAFWKDGPRKWDKQNEQYKRSGIQVTIKLYKDDDDIDQINEILNELKIYLGCHTQEGSLLFQFYGISKQPDSNDYFTIEQFSQNGSLANFISHNFNSLYWEMKLHLLLCLAEDLKALHDAGYVHRYLHPSSVLAFDDNFCAIGSFSKCCKISSNTEEIIGWFHYTAPECLLKNPYTKSSDIYSFGVIMHTIGTGNVPHRPLCVNQSLTLDICLGLRPYVPDNMPKCFRDLMEKCWNTEPGLRPNINEVYNILLNLWSSIYHNNHLTPLNSTFIEFLVADNDKDYSKSNSQEMVTQNDNLEPLEMIKYIKENNLAIIFSINELTMMTPIVDNDPFCKISIAILKKGETDSLVVCKRFKSTQLDKNFFDELKMHKKLYFCLKILRILGVSLDEDNKEYLLIMQYADGGNLRQYFKDHFTELTWDDKLNFAYQITEGTKYLHDEDVFHQNLHPKNILIHKNEAKILLNIVKSTGTNYLNVSDEIIPYIDPKLLENQSYEYDKKSDIYSLGVLMWELSSGYPPFINDKTENLLEIHLMNDYREKPVLNTPNEYLELYKSCWNTEPNERPSINQVFSISLDESAGECSLIMQYVDGGNLRQYFENFFPKLTIDDKIKLAYQITEGVKFLHDLDIIHQNLHSKNIVIHKSEAKIMLDLVKGTNTDSSNDYEMISYIDPKLLENNSYELDKKSDIYSLGVLMWELTSGHPPRTENILKSHIIDGYRETRIPNTPKEYFDLYESCWYPEPNIRPSINQIFNKLEEMNKNSGLEVINLIKKYKLVKEINMEELSDMKNIDGGHFGIISRAVWEKTKNYVICKRLKNNESISNKPTEALLHELKMHGRLNFCQRIIRILGISLDTDTKEYLLIMQYADGGNLRQYLKHKFSELIWEDKVKLAYQIAEGIKFLQGENILHRDLHSGNIVIHQGEAKIIDLGIAKSTETQTNIHSGLFGSLPYIDPKILEDHSYKYNEKSDIYSLGVLMWELSSGVPPFINESENVLKYSLISGRREKPIPDTPDEYLKLYESCWDPEPNKRPSISQVFNKLVKLGRTMNIQDFQDIKCDDDDMQGIQDNQNIQNENNDTNTRANISNADDNDDLDIPDDC
ncbi:kinase-like domain-containing protein [Rhizophagus clarus]|uniref:Kinase-like domain-containing protein n=1 Tax=Rhizophagus clarus TaxID=94130 RepID=A0A8H3KW09_9GLOM|nr:kinase-like domain-containing protein [Rhizophagus clarus]